MEGNQYSVFSVRSVLSRILNTEYRILGFIASLSVALSCLIWLPALRGDAFPRGDGGLFAAMIDAIIAHGYRLPQMVQYGADVIPFAYPPLGLAIAALVANMSSTLFALQWLPFVWGLLTFPLLVWLASRWLRSRWAVLATACAYPLLSGLYDQLLFGGGVTRAAGLFFALLAVCCASELMRHNHNGLWVLLAVSLAATLLSHLVASIVAVGGVAIVFGLNLRKLDWRKMALAAGLTILLIAPWVWVTLSRHGVEPFLSAQPTGFFRPKTDLLNFFWPADWTVRRVTLIGLVGIGIFGRKPKAALWYLWVLLFAARAPYAKPLMIALMTGAATEIIHGVVSQKLQLKPIHRQLVVTLTVALAILLGVYRQRTFNLESLSPHMRQSMQWIAANTQPDDVFTVVTPVNWANDLYSEWLPYLADRPNLTTAQGAEWLPNDEFSKRVTLISELQLATTDTTHELGDVTLNLLDQTDYLVFLGYEPPDLASWNVGVFEEVYTDQLPAPLTILARR